MVGPDHATEAVEDVAAAGVQKIWLFKGVGAPGAASPDAISACERHGLDTVAGRARSCSSSPWRRCTGSTAPSADCAAPLERAG